MKGDKPQLMGVLNLTPDSFSDGGLYFGQPEKAIRKLKTLRAEGAEIIDIGAESSRPGAQRISSREEITRLETILGNSEIREIQLSLDSRRAETVEFFLNKRELEITFINDVSSLEDPAMPETLIRAREDFAWHGAVILTHHRGIPPSKEDFSQQTNFQIIEELEEFFQRRLELLEKVGFPREQVILDPGLGFGKNLEETLLIIKNISSLKKTLGLKILVGHSRKRFISHFLSDKLKSLIWRETDLQTKDLASHNFALILASKKIEIIRSHEIKLLRSLIDLLFSQ